MRYTNCNALFATSSDKKNTEGRETETDGEIEREREMLNAF